MLTVNHKFFLCETSKTNKTKQTNKKQNTWFTIVTPKHKEKKKITRKKGRNYSKPSVRIAV